MRYLFILLLTAVSSFAAPFSFGVKVGVPFNDLFSGSGQFVSSTDSFIVGPEVSLNLPFGLGVEFNALYRQFDYRNLGLPSTSASAWEFPLLARYRFPGHIVRPFVNAGVAWNKISGVTSIGNGISGNTVSGFVMGAGLDLHLLVLHLKPEIRYTRWGAQSFLSPNGGISNNQNQAEFLVGITF